LGRRFARSDGIAKRRGSGRPAACREEKG